jgi:hypothetical protein
MLCMELSKIADPDNGHWYGILLIRSHSRI